MKKVFIHGLNVLKALVYYIYTCFFTKDKKLWVFGAWKGNSYCDNTKYLFEYVIQNEKDIKAVWVTKNQSVYENLRKRGCNVEIWPSKAAKKIVKHAGYFFQTEGNRDIGEFRVGRSKIIQLWHGIALKRHNWFGNYSKIKKILISIYGDNHSKSIWTSPSQFHSEVISDLMGIPMKNIYCTGCPRNDSFVHPDMNSAIVQEIKNNGCKTAIYLPTHRNFGKDFDAQFIMNGLRELDTKIGERRIRLYYKPHPNEVEMLKDIMEKEGEAFENVRILAGEAESDLYSYLHAFDCLIADYSSVAYDYICTGRPIIYFNYDMEKYISDDAGIGDEYFEYQSGPFCKTWDEVYNSLVDVLGGNDMWKEQRERCRLYVNPFNDGQNCARVVQMVRSLF